MSVILNKLMEDQLKEELPSMLTFSPELLGEDFISFQPLKSFIKQVKWTEDSSNILFSTTE